MRSMKKIKKIYLIIPVILALLTILINYSFFKPTKINSFIASKVYNTPANSYFDDNNFYQCVVDAYNDENDTELSYNTSLTDEQLQSITEIDCHDMEIVNTNGIEKLTNLVYADLAYNNLKTINVSKNDKLVDLEIVETEITSIDVSKNIELETLRIEGSYLSAIDLSQNTKLKKLYLGDNDISTIDLSKNIELEYLDIALNNLNVIDLSSNINLQYLEITGNNIESIDLSKNINLTDLIIYASSSKIILPNNIETTEIDDVLTGLDHIKYIKYGNEKIINPDNTYIYYYSNNISIKTEENINDFIDDLNLNNLQAKIYNGDEEITEGNIKAGYTLKIYDNDIIFDQVPISIFNNISGFEDERLYRCAIDAYNDLNDENLSYNDELTNDQLLSITELNCADETGIAIKKTSDLKKLKNLKILQIFLTKNPIDVEVEENTKLESLITFGDVNNIKGIKKLTNLETLMILANLEKIDLDFSNLTKLKKLYILSNYGKFDQNKLNISKNINLEYLRIEETEMNAIDISNNINLEELYLANNNLESIDLSKNVKLKKLHLKSNKIDTIDLSKNENLTVLELSDNKLETIDVSNMKDLVALGLNYNNIKEIDLSNNTKLKEINLDNNNLKNIDISKQTNLIGIRIKDNPLEHDIGIYVGEYKDLNYDLGFVKYSDTSKKPTLVSNSISGDINFENSNIYSKEPGVYTVKARYSLLDYVGTTDELRYSYSSSYNSYEGTYNVHVIKATSDKYVINNEKEYIYTGRDQSNQIILNNISLNYGTAEVKDYKLLIKYNEDILKEFDIKNVDFGIFKSGENSVAINESVSYETFINNITVSEGLSYKIFNNEEEVTSGNISIGMKLNIYYDNEIIDTYNITDEFIDLSLLNIDEDKKLIKESTLGLTIEEFKEKISTSGNIIITNKNNKTLTDTDIIQTGAKVKIELSAETYEYTISVKGDVSGDGLIDIADIAKQYQYFRKKITMEDCYIEASDVANNDSAIDIADVAKLYQYFRKKITSLE